MSVPALEVDHLSKRYRLARTSLFGQPEIVRAVDDVTFSIARGRTLGVVGESGCGKSTLARAVTALDPPTAGSVRILGTDLNQLGARALRAHRRHFQMVFQDPFGSLNPRHRVARIVAEPLDALDQAGGGGARAARLAAALDSVGLRPHDADKFPHEFSGGQRQRIAIARALITRPALVVADEPVSALDVSVQAQVLNLLQDLKARHALTYMLISHDLAVIGYMCDEVVVMYLGRIVEYGPTAEVLARPAHPYTQALIEAVPVPVPGRRRRSPLKGAIASPTGTTVGCALVDRCPRAEARCRSEAPTLREVAPGRTAACHFA